MDNFERSTNILDFLNSFWTMLPNKGTFKMDWYLPSPKWMFVINALLLLLHVSVAKTLAPIKWDKHIFASRPEGYRIEANINDLVEIICPRVNNSDLAEEQAQYHKFTLVTRQGYEQCNLSPGPAVTLLRCNRPLLENQLRLLFQDQTTYPGDPVFKHGRDYYFITTSDGTKDGIDQASGGLCRTHHMKLIVHMKGEGFTGSPYPTQSTTRGRYRPPPTTPKLPILKSTTKYPKVSTKLTTTVKPTRRKPTIKKPNKSGENDPLTGDGEGGGRSSNHRLSFTLLLLCVTVAFVRWL